MAQDEVPHPHQATTGVIFCMDDRPTLDQAYRRLVDTAEGGCAYSLRFGGAALWLVESASRELVLGQLRLMQSLGVTKIVVANHRGCAACKERLGQSGQDELSFHALMLQEAADQVEQLGLVAETRLFNEDGTEATLPPRTLPA